MTDADFGPACSWSWSWSAAAGRVTWSVAARPAFLEERSVRLAEQKGSLRSGGKDIASHCFCCALSWRELALRVDPSKADRLAEDRKARKEAEQE